MSYPDEPVSILLVDDKPENLLTLESVLSGLGLNIVKADSGRSALKWLLQQDFAAILLDVNMPGMDGFETARMIRQRKNSEHTPILFVTAFSDDMQIARGYSLGAVDYILTPFVPEVLQAKVSVFIELYRKTMEVRRQAHRLKQRAEQLHQLNQASLAIHSALALESVWCVAVDTAREILGVRMAALVAGEDMELEHARKVVSPLPQNGDAKSVAPDDADLRLLASLDAERRLSVGRAEIPPRPGVRFDQVRQTLVAPLTNRNGRTVGFLQVADKKEGEFTDDDKSLLLQLAQMACIAIENTLGAEAREANRLKDEFLANVSHELRTPMNAIIGMTDLALNEAVSPSVHDYLKTVKESAQVLLSLLNDILDFSKIEAGKFAFDNQAFRIRDLLNETIKTMAIQASQKNLDLSCSIENEVPDGVIGDPLRLRQVLTNLISNAIKFTEKGSVRVSVKVESQDARQMRLHFVVTDTGIGISPEDQRKIFAPFTQADSSLTRHFSGTGLGLTISAELVKMMDGNIQVESQLGTGSTFSFTASFRRPAEWQYRKISSDYSPAIGSSAATESIPPKNGSQDIHILVAEDTPANQKLINTVLKKLGYSFETVSNGQQALDRLSQRHFDLMLLDVQMPVMSGMQVASIVREQEKSDDTHIPIIAMTAHAMPGDAERCLAAGMDAYLSKPLDIGSLAELINRFVVQTPTPV